MKVIVAGTRTIWDYTLVDRFLGICIEKGLEIDSVVCGMAPGVDSVGWAWAHINDIPIDEFPADWNQYGKRAGMIRNTLMASHADALVLVWDGKSPGSNNMLKVAQQYHLKIAMLVRKGDEPWLPCDWFDITGTQPAG